MKTAAPRTSIADRLRRGADLIRPPNLFYLGAFRRLQRRFLETHPGRGLNLGSGATALSIDLVNLDVAPLPNVQVVADGGSLPFRDSTFPVVLCEAVLEHVSDPWRVRSELARVLAPGGEAFVVVPFMTPFHASPGTREDYHRFTVEGLKSLVAPMEILEIGPCVGPASTLCLVADGIFGAALDRLIPVARVAGLIRAALGWIIVPLKFLDAVLLRAPGSLDFAASLYVIARKRGGPAPPAERREKAEGSRGSG